MVSVFREKIGYGRDGIYGFPIEQILSLVMFVQCRQLLTASVTHLPGTPFPSIFTVPFVSHQSSLSLRIISASRLTSTPLLTQS